MWPSGRSLAWAFPAIQTSSTFFFSRRRRHTRLQGDWSSDVCSSDLGVVFAALNGFASDPQARVHAFCHAVPGAWHTMGVMLSAAGSLSWLHTALAPETSLDRKSVV